MEKTVPERRSVWIDPWRAVRAMAAALLFGLAVSAPASAQNIVVTGTVSSTSGSPLPGVAVAVQGTTSRTLTGENGRYSISAPGDGILTFVLFGRKPQQATIGGRTRIDITMSGISYLEEVVVTAYQEQRRGDITGAVSSINIESAQRPTSASILQRLDAVPGITVASSGSPGSRSTVRIRGISSFQNNDPLYVIDGVPVQDSYINFINPNDISSIQVLKDASSASIYGSRASNGVILIETIKRGVSGPPKMVATMRTGYASPVRGYDDFLLTNSLDYFAVEKASYVNAGLPVPTNIFGDPNSPTVPTYTYAAPGTGATTNSFGQITGVDLSKYAFPGSLIQLGSQGTNWWDAVFGKPGRVGDYNLSITGAGQDNGYGVSFNFFNQDGTAAYNNFKRANVRVNSQFNRGKLQFGENVALSGERHFGGLSDDAGGETALIGKNILSQPVVAIYDAMGNFASGKAVGLGNNTNPLKTAYEARNNISANNRVFGNVFTGLTVNPYIALRSSLGFSVNQGTFSGYTPPTPENAEASFSNSVNENQNTNTDWTWSNTGKFSRQYNRNSLSLLLGQEAQHSQNRGLQGSQSNLLSTDLNARYIQDALGDAKSKVVNSFGGESALLSFFGKADYTFADKYIMSGTIRRDGSSRLGPTHQWGTFPAAGLGWHVSKESFLENNHIISDALLRVGYGVTGNQSIPSGRTVNQFGGSNGDTYYDINGANVSVVSGYREVSLGNADLRWEEQKSTNFGADLALFDNALNVVIDLYSRNTDNLLFNPGLPATAGLAASPIVNIGKMNNKGFDFSVGHQGENWNATLTGSHYKNEIVAIDGVQTSFSGPFSNRVGRITINQVGSPIGSFFGLQSLGYFKDAADVAASPTQTGAKPGRIKFADTNGDKVINDKDRVIIGSPHPKFTGGLDLGFRRGNWDLNGSIFGSFGNKIFESQKDFYVFQDFSTNVRDDLLANSWTPSNLDAKYPRLDVSDTYSKAISSYYVEDGSYARLRNLQLGYNVPQSMSKFLSATRVYVQAENLFTVTRYPGLDPSLPKLNTTGSLGDTRDQAMGIDSGVYPSSRTISIGFSTSF
ncbi:MAG: SusC/RagA family TonB-linked outer membrane protein [Gemmatimonadaceae bacterium]